ncbi:MAG: DEAD/DEAH box helicase, partial [Methylomicrobium sp.]|nr:DEAD/DEAH box helicase [Methylomicrobium sp.]
MLTRGGLHHYQNKAVDTILDRQKCALWLDLGLGKSVVTLTAISDLLDGFAVKRVLVIAPLRVARSVWLDEAKKWEHLNDLRISVCVGDIKKRTNALSADADIFVINRECVPWLVNFYGKKWPFDMIVVDESTSFKNPTRQRFKALRRVSGRANYMVLLSGTPIPNGLADLWSQFYLLDGGERLGRTLTQFRSRWFTKHYSGFGYVPNAGALDEVKNIVSDITLSMGGDEYLE